MEEEPVMVAPDIEKHIEEENNFIISQTAQSTQKNSEPSETEKKIVEEQFFDIDFSDVEAEQKEMSKEDIIAAAEAAAFQEDNNK